MADASTVVEQLGTCHVVSMPHLDCGFGTWKPLANAFDPQPPLSEAQRRKQSPMYTGLLVYFPDALEEVAHVSWKGNEQHNPGQPVHWAKEKSTDEPDCIIRHLTDHARGTVYDSDGLRHLAKVAWRALANLQREIERERDGKGRG